MEKRKTYSKEFKEEATRLERNRCRVLISALADICLSRYIEKTCQT